MVDMTIAFKITGFNICTYITTAWSLRMKDSVMDIISISDSVTNGST